MSVEFTTGYIGVVAHIRQLLGSAYALGASSKQLQDAYDHETAELLAIDDTFLRGDKISRDNWRDFRNQKQSVDEP